MNATGLAIGFREQPAGRHSESSNLEKSTFQY